MIHLLSAVLAGYLWLNLLRMRRYRPGLRWALAVFVLIASQHHLVTRNFFGTLSSPEVPAPLLMLLGWAYGAVLLTAVALLALDLAGLLVWLPSRRHGRQLLGAQRARAGIAAVAAVAAAVGVWQAVRVPQVRAVQVELAQLPAQLDGFRIAQLTDLHASRLLRRTWQHAVVEQTQALGADLIVITGDLADGTVRARHDDVEPLAALKAPQGVFAIPGNHEYYAEYLPWLQRLRALGLRLLLNESVEVGRGDARFILAGVTDVVANRYGQPLPDIQAALAGADPKKAVVLLAHRPGDAWVNARAGAHLQLSGHTHGGQVLGLHWLTQMANNGFVSGLYRLGPMQLYVSNGTGLWAGFVQRLGRPSEITLITLRSAQARGPALPDSRQ